MFRCLDKVDLKLDICYVEGKDLNKSKLFGHILFVITCCIISEPSLANVRIAKYGEISSLQ